MSEVALAADGPSAPPRANGEIIFGAPWQSRVFGLTAALVEEDHVSWDAFQQSLIARVAQADADNVNDYWGCWRDALGDLCVTTGLITAEQWADRAGQLAARPAGHDHDHHDHDHHDHGERT